MQMRLLSAFLVLFAGVGWASSLATPAAEAAASASCVVADDDALHASGTETEMGWFEHEEWIANDGSQVAKDALDDKIIQRFGDDSKANRYVRLSNGLIGVALDHYAQEIVVVVDPTLVNVGQLAAELAAVAEAEHQRDPTVAKLVVRVQPGCFSSAELLAAGSTIDAQIWHPGASQVSYSSKLEESDSTYHLLFAEVDRPVAEALSDILGKLVKIKYTAVGGPTRDDRADDGQPHWGGAGIGVDGDGVGNVCTSGFTVDTEAAGKAMVTAGHCFRNGDIIESGNEPYGRAQGEHDFPAYDMILINAANQNYDDDLYHNPYRAESDPIDVDGGRNAEDGDYLCISGMRRLAECGLEVTDTNEQFCDPGCTYVLLESTKNGANACGRGDSGAPMYHRPTNVRVHGMHIARDDPSRNDICLAEQTSFIEAHLSVTVATSP